MTESDYSNDQVVHVQRIKRCKDYYEVLQVSKDASEMDLKKNYRKLALQLHPDKNKAPGAAEAFKAVGNAFAVLNDKDKRRQYDMYGSEDSMSSQSASSSARSGYYDGGDGYYYDYSRGFEGNVSPEDLFNMFFGGGFPTGSIYVHRPRQQRHARQQRAQEDHSARSLLLQLLPLLLLVGVSMISQLMVSDPPYALHKSAKYLYERQTSRLNVVYYVKESFIEDHKNSLNRIENEVEEDYLIHLRQNCYRETNHKQTLLFQARHYQDAERERKARAYPTPSCTKYKEKINLMNRYV